MPRRSNKAQRAQRVGNTPQRAKKRRRARAWCFTVNNHTEEDIVRIITNFDKDPRVRYVFQEEEGEEKHTAHLQGVVRFGNPRDFNGVKHIMEKAHWSECRNWEDSVNYCSDPTKRAPGGRMWKSGMPAEVRDIIDEKGYLSWQESLIHDHLGEDPDDRKIIWIYDEKGGKGKTKFCKHMLLKHPRQTIFISGKSSDVFYAVMKHVDEEGDLKFVFVDVPRSTAEYLSYQAIEKVKDGVFFSTKYESKQCIFNEPHVVVFANSKPKMNKLSIDRWDIYKISEENHLVPMTDLLVADYEQGEQIVN